MYRGDADRSGVSLDGLGTLAARTGRLRPAPTSVDRLNGRRARQHNAGLETCNGAGDEEVDRRRGPGLARL